MGKKGISVQLPRKFGAVALKSCKSSFFIQIFIVLL